MIKVIIDTNVLISALIKPKSNPTNPALVLNLILDGKFKLCLSEAIFQEYEEVLARPKFSRLDQKAVKKLLQLIKKESCWVIPTKKVNLIKEDPQDNIFLECAQEAKVNFIITGNSRHFPKIKFKNALIVSPGEFIELVAIDFFNDKLS
jgi:uncharacterized protein